MDTCAIRWPQAPPLWQASRGYQADPLICSAENGRLNHLKAAIVIRLVVTEDPVRHQVGHLNQT